MTRSHRHDGAPAGGGRARRPGGDTGSITLELVVWAPALLLIVALLVVAGRVALARGAASHAADEAARAASLARTPAAARADAVRVADASMRAQGLACAAVTVDVDTSGFGVAVGDAATVSATVHCALRLSDVGLPGLPGSRTLTASAVSPLDSYRERS